MRVRRVGSVTCGCLLILFGVLFIAHMILPMISYSFIYKLWPLVLVALGAEMLLVNRKHSDECEIKYDTGAILLVVIMAFFSMGMGAAEYAMSHASVIYW